MTQEIPALEPRELQRIDACWRAATCLSVGPLYLRGIPSNASPKCPGSIDEGVVNEWSIAMTSTGNWQGSASDEQSVTV